MPRLISRLLDRLEHAPVSNKTKAVSVRRRRKISLRTSLPPPPSLSPFNRTQSILVDNINPVINASAYTRHKSLPPMLLLHKSQRQPVVAADDDDRPRYMTNSELRWWSSPYRV